MAEIRKHDPSKGNAIAQALRAAMGEEIRPVTPGQATPAKKNTPEPTGGTTWVNLTFTGAATEAEAEADRD